MHACLIADTGDFCLEVVAASPCQPFFFAPSIPISIPIGATGTMGGVPGILKIDIFGANRCVSIKLDLPKCP